MSARDGVQIASYRDTRSGCICSISVDRMRGVIYFDVTADRFNGGGGSDKNFLRGNPSASNEEIIDYVKNRYFSQL